MLDWLRRRRLSATARKKLMIVTARAEEALIETHVANLLDVLDAVGDEVEVGRAIELYLEEIPMEEQLAATVTNRLLARLDTPRARRAERSPRTERSYKGAFRDKSRR